MPFADLAGAIAGLLEHAGTRPLASREPATLPRERHRRHAAADREATCHRGCSARRAAWLTVERHELQALGRQSIQMRSGRAAVLTPAIAAQITPPDVVGHEHDDVGLRPRGFGHNPGSLSSRPTPTVSPPHDGTRPNG